MHARMTLVSSRRFRRAPTGRPEARRATPGPTKTRNASIARSIDVADAFFVGYRSA